MPTISPEESHEAASVPPAVEKPANSATSSSVNAPLGHALRRARTVADSSPSPKRPSITHISSDSSFEGHVRRSSNFSDLSLGEARDFLNPKPYAGEVPRHEASSLASASLAFALLPALAGALFKNGSAVVTDVMLLGLAAVFLNWSVTQPWSWYHSAQEIRVREEASTEAIIDEDDDDLESLGAGKDQGSTSLDDVPEEEEGQGSQSKPSKEKRERRTSAKQQAAISELYMHEVLALLSCFLLPLVGTYLLHTIRSQLSRPSEGLVSNYNLTIFLLVSELRVLSHMITLVQSRTLHLQRVVHENPYSSSDGRNQLDELRSRLDRLESRSAAEEVIVQQHASSDFARVQQEATMTREVRSAIQPELDALNRAVRRYEKKATLLQYQTEARFSAIDARLDDVIALAAAAAKNSNSQKNVALRMVESIGTIILFPLSTVIQILLLPLKTLLALLSRKKQYQPPVRGSRGARTSKTHSQSKYGGDRMPSRVTKR